MRKIEVADITAQYVGSFVKPYVFGFHKCKVGADIRNNTLHFLEVRNTMFINFALISLLSKMTDGIHTTVPPLQCV